MQLCSEPSPSGMLTLNGRSVGEATASASARTERKIEGRGAKLAPVLFDVLLHPMTATPRQRAEAAFYQANCHPGFAFKRTLPGKSEPTPP